MQGRPELSPRAGSLNPGERSINSGCQFGFNMRIADLSSSDREKLRRHKGRGRASSCPEPHPRCAAVRFWLAGQRRPPRLFPANSGLTLVPPPSLLSHRPASGSVPRPAPVPLAPDACGHFRFPEAPPAEQRAPRSGYGDTSSLVTTPVALCTCGQVQMLGHRSAVQVPMHTASLCSTAVDTPTGPPAAVSTCQPFLSAYATVEKWRVAVGCTLTSIYSP